MTNTTIQTLRARIRELEAQLVTAHRQIGALKRGPIKNAVSMLEIGTQRDGATVIGYEGGLHVLQCACGAHMKKARRTLGRKPLWRCMACIKKARSEVALRYLPLAPKDST
jgi:hypothetical protein